MSAYDGAIRINTKLYTEDYKNGLNNLVSSTKSSFSKIGRITGDYSNSLTNLSRTTAASFSKIGALVGGAVSIAALVKFGKESIDLASDLNEVQNVVDTAFGDMAYKMEEFADTSIEKFGLSKLSAKQMGSVFASMGRGIGQSLDIATDSAIELTGRLGDVMSFYNLSAERAKTLGKAVYSGETEPLKEIGIIMTQDNLSAYALANGYKKLYKNMSPAEKLMIRQKYFIEQTSLAAGDFVKTQDSWANQTKILSERWKEFMTEVGSSLTTVLAPAVKMLNNIVSVMIDAASAVNNVVQKLFGVASNNANASAKAISGAAIAMSDYGDATEAAGKQAANATAGFDDLDVLSEESTGGIGTSMEDMIPKIEEQDVEDGAVDKIDEIDAKILSLKDRFKELVDLFKNGFNIGFSANNLDNMLVSIKGIGDALKNIFSNDDVQSAFKKFIESLVSNFGRVVGSIASIGTTIGSFIFGGLENYLNDNAGFLSESLVTLFDIGSGVATLIGNISETISTILAPLGGEAGQKIAGNLFGIFANTFINIKLLSAKVGLDILSAITNPFYENKDKIANALSSILPSIESITRTIKEYISHAFDSINRVYDEHFRPVFEIIERGTSSLIGSIADIINNEAAPVFNSIAEKFDELVSFAKPVLDDLLETIGHIGDIIGVIFENVIFPVSQWIIENTLPKLFEGIGILWTAFVEGEKILFKFFRYFSKIFNDILTFIEKVFQGDWKGAWESIGKIFTDVWDGIVSAFKFTVNIIVGLVNKIIESVEYLVNRFVDSVNSMISKAIEIANEVPGISINAPQLNPVSFGRVPYLANGGITTGATLSMIGEAGREAVLPLENNTEWMNDLAEVIADNNLNRATTVVFELNGTEIGRALLPVLNKENNRVGTRLSMG